MKSTEIKLGELKLTQPTIGTHKDTCITIEFEDKGQDFIQWQLDKEGKVVDSLPYQSEIWKGTIVNLQQLKIGVEPLIITKYGGFTSLNYKVKSVKV